MTPAGLHVLTGGPGSGKTSLVAALAAIGVAHGQEAGRAIIRAEQASGGDALPWADRAAFARRMATMDRATRETAMAGPRPCVLDRGVPDAIGYLRLCGLPVPADLMAEARGCRYDRTVFVAPFWPAIFHQDNERRQDADEARRTGDVMRGIYGELGYRLVELPLAPVSERVRFVAAAIGLG